MAERDWTSVLASVNRILDRNGRSVAFYQLDKTPADPDRPWRGAGTPTLAGETVVKAVFVPVSGYEFGEKLIPADLLKQVEEIALVTPAAPDFTDYNVVVDGAERYAIQWLWKLQPGSTVLLYAVGLKR